MRSNVFDVLMYLFEHYPDDGPEFHSDQKQLALELSEAGFRRGEIRKALRWLDGLTRDGAAEERLDNHPASLRHYDASELRKLDAGCRGFLLLLEQHGVLDARTRERVIERALALDLETLALEQLKWIVLMVLNHQPGYEYAHALVEDMVYDDLQGQGQLH